jgi:ankyrin repeat protein
MIELSENQANVGALPSPERIQELLFAAARMGRIDVIPELVRAGADLEGHDSRGYNALILASYNGQEEATRLLLSLGALPDGADGERGNTALMGISFKGYDSIARILVDAGANVNARNFNGQTALMTAVLFNQIAIIDMLLEAGADVATADMQGNTVVTLARSQGNALLLQRFAEVRGE